MDQNQELIDQLQSIVDKLIDLFGSEYQMSYVDISQQQEHRVTHVTHVHHNYPLYYYPWYYPDRHCCYQTKTNKKKKDEEEEEEEEDDNKSMDKFVGMIIISGVSLVGTVVFATDGYVTLKRSRISGNLEEIVESSQLIGKFNDVHDAIEKCKKWLGQYERRTKPMFWSKVGLIASGLAFGLGMFISNDKTKNAAIGGSILSGCYMLWNFFSRSDSKDKESRYFNDAVSSVNMTKLALANPAYVAPAPYNPASVAPSAPHLSDFKQ